MKKVIAHAHVRLTIKIGVPDTWGEDCAFSQVKKQAIESALGMIKQGGMQQDKDYSLVGGPVVTAILLEDT